MMVLISGRLKEDYTLSIKTCKRQPPIEGREVPDWEAEISRLYIQGAGELDEAKRKQIYAETQRLTQSILRSFT
jgi:hypothetical protein